MNTVYTTTITEAASRRGISVVVLDQVLPVFELSYGRRTIRCYNSLTDLTGSATFHLTQDKGAANRFLKRHGFHVPSQEQYVNMDRAVEFLDKHELIVVKPVAQWGGHGVSTHITSPKELRDALRFAHSYSDDILLEECVHGKDWRLIYVNFEFVTAIERIPAQVKGNGSDTIRKLIQKKNAFARKSDASNIVPFDKETQRTIEVAGFSYDSVLDSDCTLQVRRTSNYHTGGTVSIIGDSVGRSLIELGKSIASLVQAPVLGVDILVDDSDHHHIIELSPDLAISPPEGYLVAEKFLDYLFPESKVEGNAEEWHVSDYQNSNPVKTAAVGLSTT